MEKQIVKEIKFDGKPLKKWWAGTFNGRFELVLDKDKVFIDSCGLNEIVSICDIEGKEGFICNTTLPSFFTANMPELFDTFSHRYISLGKGVVRFFSCDNRRNYFHLDIDFKIAKPI